MVDRRAASIHPEEWTAQRTTTAVPWSPGQESDSFGVDSCAFEAARSTDPTGAPDLQPWLCGVPLVGVLIIRALLFEVYNNSC